MDLEKVDIVSTELVEGEVRCNIGQGDAGTLADVTIWSGSDGFIGRPTDADDDGNCMGLYAAQGNSRRLIATKDNRIIAKYGELDQGDRAIITKGPARVLVKNTAKSVTLLTLGGGEDTNPIFIQVDGESGKIEMMCAGQNGAKVSKITMSPAAMFLGVSGGGSITIDMQGVTIGGSHFACNTKGGNLGLIGPANPIAPVQSILLGVTGMAASPAPFWVVSNS
jgi:hypothetical protein